MLDRVVREGSQELGVSGASGGDTGVGWDSGPQELSVSDSDGGDVGVGWDSDSEGAAVLVAGAGATVIALLNRVVDRGPQELSMSDGGDVGMGWDSGGSGEI